MEQVCKDFVSEYRTATKTRWDNIYLVIRIKMYDKISCLRVEMTINDPKEFKVLRDVQHRDGSTSKRWVPVGKSISNLYRYAEISKDANRRFLHSMQNIIPDRILEKEINSVCVGKTVKGRIISGKRQRPLHNGGFDRSQTEDVSCSCSSIIFQPVYTTNPPAVWEAQYLCPNIIFHVF